MHLIWVDSADSFPELRIDPHHRRSHFLSSTPYLRDIEFVPEQEDGQGRGKRVEVRGRGGMWGDGGAGGKYAQLSEGNTGRA